MTILNVNMSAFECAFEFFASFSKCFFASFETQHLDIRRMGKLIRRLIVKNLQQIKTRAIFL